jgi:hypothetical protein
MCLAIFKEANKKVKKREMQIAFDNNDDGAGFAYPSNGKVIIEKGFFKFSDFWNAIKPHMDKPMAIHFRWSTHGLVDETNCHPFRITDDLAMIHNGVINGIDIEDKNKSDTHTFVDDYVKPINKGNPMFIYSDYGNRTLKACIGSSKLVFINKKGNRVIVNESAGHWADGVWYSNESYKAVKVRYSQFATTTPYYGSYGSGCYSTSATSDEVIGKKKRKTKSKKKAKWLPQSERKALQTELQQELMLTNSMSDTQGVDSTPNNMQMLKPNTDPVEDANGVFCPLVGDEYSVRRSD